MDTIRPPIKNENPQGSPRGQPEPTHQRNDGSCATFLDDDSFTGGSSSSSSLDTIGPAINHENPHLLPYPSSTTLQSNGGVCHASFMTSPSYDSFIEVLDSNSSLYPDPVHGTPFVPPPLVPSPPRSKTPDGLPIKPPATQNKSWRADVSTSTSGSSTCTRFLPFL